MVHIQWKDRYNIHFREIDAQHHGLLDILNELIDLLGKPSDPKQVARIFRDLRDYARTHFSSEERYMAAAGYPKLAEHRMEHAGFITRVHDLSETFSPWDPALVEQTLEFLKHWYLDHITQADQDYAPCLKQALPSNSIEAILFGLEGTLGPWDLAPVVEVVAKTSGKTPEEVRRMLVADPGLMPRLESGTIDQARFFSELAEWAGCPISREAVLQAYGKCLQPVPAMAHLAKCLRVRYPVALVGNATPWYRSQKLPRAGVHEAFSADAFSCDVGARLPDQAVFQEATKRLGLPPEACLLIHSDEPCQVAAQAIGMQTLHFTKPVMLMAELRHMGIVF